MNERESDPTGAFRGGAAGLEDDPRTGTEYERHAPDGAEPGGGQPNTGSTGDDADAGDAAGSAERTTVVEGTAATSEIADPDAQANAERQGDGTPQPR